MYRNQYIFWLPAEIWRRRNIHPLISVVYQNQYIFRYPAEIFRSRRRIHPLTSSPEDPDKYTRSSFSKQLENHSMHIYNTYTNGEKSPWPLPKEEKYHFRVRRFQVPRILAVGPRFFRLGVQNSMYANQKFCFWQLFIQGPKTLFSLGPKIVCTV